VKIVDLRDKHRPSEVDSQKVCNVKHEVDIHKKIGHHNHVVRLHCAVMENQIFYLVMEKCNKSLWALLDGLPCLGEPDLVRIFGQMLTAIAHVNSVGVVHRDIKPDNFLSTADGITLKLCDFGLSRELPSKNGLRGVYGTAPYMSPEMLGGKTYDEKTDVWSFGVVAYVLLFGQFPYIPESMSASRMKAAILRGRPDPSFVPNTDLVGERDGPSKRATEFVMSLLCRSSEQRPSASQALSNEFIKLEANARDDRRQVSFRPMLYAARKVGAFENKNLSNVDHVDGLLSDMQLRHQNQVLDIERESVSMVGDKNFQSKERTAWTPTSGSTCLASSNGSELVWSRETSLSTS